MLTQNVTQLWVLHYFEKVRIEPLESRIFDKNLDYEMGYNIVVIILNQGYSAVATFQHYLKDNINPILAEVLISAVLYIYVCTCIYMCDL